MKAVFVFCPVILLVFIALIESSCGRLQKTEQQSGIDQAFTYSVTGCAAIKNIDENNPPVRMHKSSISNESPQLAASGDSIVYHRFATHLCCRRATMTVAYENNAITFTEDWRGKGCKCKCDSHLKATLRKLSAGSFRVLVIRKGTDPFDDKTQMPPDTLYKESITLQ